MTEEQNYHQFQIPKTEKVNSYPYKGGFNDNREKNSQFVSYEKVAEPYSIIKKIEEKIYDSRETALAQQRLNASRNRGWLYYLGILPTTELDIDDLVEQESRLGGALFGEGHRFWLDVKSKGSLTGAADWYYSRPNPVNPKEELTLRFQTTDTGIHKLFNGLERPMTIEDLEHFVKAVPAYVETIGGMYPVDSTLAELQEEIAASKREDFDLAA